MAKKFSLKTKCPYCRRIEVHKNLDITHVVIQAYLDYTYEDIQCGMCGSKYDICFSFECYSKKHSKSLIRVGLL
jgi:hypothetical protein